MNEIYLLALVFGTAAALALLMRRFKQPLIVSYIAAGAVLSAFGLVRVEQLSFVKFLPEIGLAFLLFLVGMELDLRELRTLGKNVVIGAVSQVVLAAIILFVFWHSLPGSFLTTLFLGVAFSFSSTILVVKLLLESKELGSLHGKLTIGILLFEDLLAIVVLMLLSNLGPGSGLSLSSLGTIVFKGIFLIWLALFSGRKILPRFFNSTAENGELLIISAIAWCLVFVSASQLMGFSLGIGAFLAGLSLAQSVYRTAISGRMKPLRDFFVMIFFVDLGVSLFPLGSSFVLLVPIILVIYSVIVKPVIFFLLFLAMGFRSSTAFKTAIFLSSVSEFSLIILFLAANNGVIPKEIVPMLAFATVISFVLSSFLITHGKTLYRLLGNHLKLLERKKTIGLDYLPKSAAEFSGHAVLVGCHRSGDIILKELRKIYGENLIVVDFNPEIISSLREKMIPCVYGDAADLEVLESLNLKQANLVISTVRDLNDNLTLLDYLERVQSKAVIIITASDVSEAITLYERGAHHVSLPLTLEGMSIGHLVSEHGENLHRLIADKEKKLGELKRLHG